MPRALLAIALVSGGAPVRGLIFYVTEDPAHNTTPPTGDLADSGWQWQADWRGFGGTAVGSHWFLTAQHLGGAVGDEFRLAGEAYRTTAWFDDPRTDLRLWRVCRPLPSFAPLRVAGDEAGNGCVLFGPGLTRGPEITVTNADQVELRGWAWGNQAGPLRWGRNRISGYADLAGQRGGLLTATFDADGEDDEVMLASGDSGGGMFIQHDGHWELAGVAYAVDGPFNYVSEDPGFHAALFDRRGLYEANGNGWTLVEPGAEPRPATLYATRVSLRRQWIQSVMTANPEPAPQLLSAATPTGTFTPVPAEPGVATGELSTALPPNSAYYQLSACQSLRIVSVAVEGDFLVFRYE